MSATETSGRMPFMQHLVELRRRIIFSLVAIFCGAVVCWIFYGWIVDTLIDPYCEVVSPNAEGLSETETLLDSGEPEPTRALTETELVLGPGNCRLLSTDPLEPLSVRFSVAAYGGAALAMPFILWQIWRFVVPALKRTERRYALFFVLSGVVLFIAGAALAYWSIPRALDFLIAVGGNDFVNIFSPRSYISFIVKMMLAFGIGFEFPVLLIFSQMIGIVQTSTLRRNRRYAIAAIVVITAILTPSGDPITLLVLSIPLYIFYELSIIYGWQRGKRLTKKSQKKLP